MHERVDGCTVFQHPLVTRLMKGFYNDQPPLPRYTCTWNVQTVLMHISAWGANEATEAAKLEDCNAAGRLTRPSRSADLSQLNLSGKHYKPDGVVFTPTSFAKQSRQGKHITEFFFPSFPHDPGLCPVVIVRAYDGFTTFLYQPQFCISGTRSSTYNQPSSMSTHSVRHYCFNRLPRQWNSLPFIDHPLSSIKETLNSHFGITNFNPDFPCTYHFLCPCAKCVSIPVSIIIVITVVFYNNHWWLDIILTDLQHLFLYTPSFALISTGRVSQRVLSNYIRETCFEFQASTLSVTHFSECKQPAYFSYTHYQPEKWSD